MRRFTEKCSPSFLMRQAFLKIPREVEEAAIVDGCNVFQMFIKVVLPMVRKFQKYTEPPFPKNLEEYIYNRDDLKYILEHVHNPHMKYEHCQILIHLLLEFILTFIKERERYYEKTNYF